MLGFCDMDGIVADFVGGVCKAYQIQNPYDSPEMLGKWDFTHYVPKYHDLGHMFWSNLEPMPDAHRIMNAMEQVFKKIYFVTAPSNNGGCISGKIAWAKKYWGHTVIPLADKELLAKPSTFLLDDRDLNCEKFTNAGGHSFLLPRIWNGKHKDRDQSVQKLIQHLCLL